jgi:hypothetical protein
VDEIIEKCKKFTPGAPDSAIKLLDMEIMRMQHRGELAQQKKKSVPEFPEVVGIVNFGHNCYFNAALQVLYQIPKLADLITPEKTFPDGRATEEEITMFNRFLLFTTETLYFMNDHLEPYRIKALQNMKHLRTDESFEAVLMDFLDSEAMIGVIEDNSSKRFLTVNQDQTVIDCLNEYEHSIACPILFFLVNRFFKQSLTDDEAYFDYIFPLSFYHSKNDVIYLFKTVVCHT